MVKKIVYSYKRQKRQVIEKTSVQIAHLSLSEPTLGMVRDSGR